MAKKGREINVHFTFVMDKFASARPFNLLIIYSICWTSGSYNSSCGCLYDSWKRLVSNDFPLEFKNPKPRLANPQGKVLLRLAVLARSIALPHLLTISSSDSLPAMVIAINKIVLRWLFPEHLKSPGCFQLWEVFANVDIYPINHFLPFNKYNVNQYKQTKLYNQCTICMWSRAMGRVSILLLHLKLSESSVSM